ncbi:MAG: peptidase S10 [Acidobacteria bacterium]|nr:peptidase S10 [Acidobacteriota bacterium]
MSRRPVLLALALTLAIAAPATAQPRPSTPPGGPPESGTSSRARPHEVSGPNEEKVAQTSHVMRLDGRELKYTATAATVPIRLDDGEIAARMFFVAYTKDGEDVGRRPISFLFNGGPGSASVWLHMGSYGPKIAKMADEGFQPPPPYELVDNPYSLLDVSDLVFVDAIDTGYSRVMPGVDNRQFHGQDGDIRAFGEFVAEYLRVYDRYPSPKFLIGESYGSIRAAGLAQELQSRHGIELNGVALLSALLTYQTLSPGPNNDIAYAAQIQTFAATAWYHKKLPADLQGRTIKEVVDEARAFAFGDYVLALTKGNTLTDVERSAMAEKLARYTGLSPNYILLANLRVDSGRFRKELLRDRRLVVGRLDGRFTALDADAAGERQEFDPSNVALAGPYVATFRHYVKNTLKWESDLHYPTSGNVRPWSYVQNRYMDMTDALRQTMAKNPFLKVFVICGYYDMATYVGGIEFNLTHMAYERQIADRVSFGYYEGGHMMYIRPSAHAALKKDTAAFIQSASGR